ncbi:MAG: flavodoxin family protein [Eubacteriales bacterium]
MKIVILMGSPRLAGNTAELCKPFISQLEKNGAEVVYITLADKHIAPCKGCYACQQVTGEYGCVQPDDMQMITKQIISSDLMVLATPIYTWYCPAEMKAMLDRFYGMNKFYGNGTGSLWPGLKIAVIATHGYDAEYGAEPFDTGIRRLCEHSNLDYAGIYSVRDTDDIASFQTKEAVNGAKQFADKLLSL